MVQESGVPSANPSLPLPKCVNVDNFLSLPGSKFPPLLSNGGVEFNVLLLKLWSTYKEHQAYVGSLLEIQNLLFIKPYK